MAPDEHWRKGKLSLEYFHVVYFFWQKKKLFGGGNFRCAWKSIFPCHKRVLFAFHISSVQTVFAFKVFHLKRCFFLA